MSSPDHPFDTQEQVVQALDSLCSQAIALGQSGEKAKVIVGITLHQALSQVLGDRQQLSANLEDPEHFASACDAVRELRDYVATVGGSSQVPGGASAFELTEVSSIE